MTELDVVDEDDTVYDFDELGAGAAIPARQEEKKDAGSSSQKVRVQTVIGSEW